MPYPADDPAVGLLTTSVADAVRRLRAGGLVAIPTETVYGLAADAEQPDAVARIYAVKGRPTGHPLIIHVATPEAIFDGWIDRDLDDLTARAVTQLARTCWPGPLTVLVPRGPRVIDAITGGRPTVALRVPAHPDAQRILAGFGGGLAAPSANRFGRVSPTTATHVLADIGDRLDPARDAVFDGGQSGVGVESTIVDLSVSPPQVLRAGAISATQIAEILDRPVAAAAGPHRASGMLASHYAPKCTIVLADDRTSAERAHARAERAGQRSRVLDRTADVVVAAFELYSDLRAADDEGLDALVVVLPAAEGLGHAVRDRLVKAAAPDRPTSRDD